MIQQCRICGIRAGGLISPDTPPLCGWPEKDLCPDCPNNIPSEFDLLLAEIKKKVSSERSIGEAGTLNP